MRVRASPLPNERVEETVSNVTAVCIEVVAFEVTTSSGFLRVDWKNTLKKLVVALAFCAVLVGTASAQGALRFKAHLEASNRAGVPVVSRRRNRPSSR